MTVKGRRLAEEWASFSEMALADAGPAQVVDMRRAFYAGARALMTLFNTQLDPGEEPTDGDVAQVERWEAELAAFLDEVRAGRA